MLNTKFYLEKILMHLTYMQKKKKKKKKFKSSDYPLL